GGRAVGVAVLALRQLADGGAAVTQLGGLVVGIEGEGDRALRAVLPGFGLEHPAGPHMIDEAAPVFFRPLPGLQGGRAVHFLRPSMRRAISPAVCASLATKRASSSRDG